MAGNRDPQRRPVLYDLKNQRFLADPAIGSTYYPITVSPGGTYLTPADIGVTVQGYDATLLNVADIGVTVQGYDPDTAKLDVEQVFTAPQTFGNELRASGGHPGVSGQVLESRGTGNAATWVDRRPRLYFYAGF